MDAEQQMFAESLLGDHPVPGGTSRLPSQAWRRPLPAGEQQEPGTIREQLDPQPGEGPPAQQQPGLGERARSLPSRAASSSEAGISQTSREWMTAPLKLHVPTWDQPKSRVLSCKQREARLPPGPG